MLFCRKNESFQQKILIPLLFPLKTKLRHLHQPILMFILFRQLQTNHLTLLGFVGITGIDFRHDGGWTCRFYLRIAVKIDIHAIFSADGFL